MASGIQFDLIVLTEGVQRVSAYHFIDSSTSLTRIIWL